MAGRIVAISVSEQKGQRKSNVESAEMRGAHGIVGDAHAGPWHRQVSMLAIESIRKMQDKGLFVQPGDFAENLTTSGISLVDLPIGSRMLAGGCVLSVTQIGKECHDRCAIYYQAGDCVMPREGIFVEVLRGGELRVGTRLEVVPAFRAAVVTLSDRCFRGEAEDTSGPALRDALELLGATAEVLVLPDNMDTIVSSLRELSQPGSANLIVTTGGTGLSPRDVTPEATIRVVERLVPGISEAIRRESEKKTNRALLSRGVSGIAGSTLIVNLPGSLRGAMESFAILEPLIPHALEVLSGTTLDCGRG